VTGNPAETEAATAAAGDAAARAAEATDRAATAAEQAAEIEAALTPEGFDKAKVLGMIEASRLDAAQKRNLGTLIESVGDDPALLGSALEQVRAALR